MKTDHPQQGPLIRWQAESSTRAKSSETLNWLSSSRSSAVATRQSYIHQHWEKQLQCFIHHPVKASVSQSSGSGSPWLCRFWPAVTPKPIFGPCTPPASQLTTVQHQHTLLWQAHLLCGLMMVQWNSAAARKGVLLPPVLLVCGSAQVVAPALSQW